MSTRPKPEHDARSADQPIQPLRITIALSGLHRIERGAEVALEAIGSALGRRGHDVTLIGSGPARSGVPYAYRRARVVDRQKFARWPPVAPWREQARYEAMTFVPGLLAQYRPGACDVTMTCGFPFENVALRRPHFGGRPRHVFITQNGDWPALIDRGEARAFSCDGLVCTNPEFFERNRERWRSAMIPNAIDAHRFEPGPAQRAELGLPPDVPVVLMVSALIASKRVDIGVRAVAELDDAILVVAGSGQESERIDALGASMLGPRYVRRLFGFDQMPALYNSADVLFHPTLQESFGNVYIEAMACGTSVVAHRSTVTEWIVGQHGALIDTDEHDAVVAALREAIDSPTDATAGRERVLAEFTWDRVADRYERFLTEVVGAD
jgi:glycosyltransferase involved in cell wall biosynthesis